MAKRFTPIALLFGMLSALLLGGVGVAQAGTLEFDCNQVVGVNVLSCNEINVKDVKVVVKANRVLTVDEVVKVENVLNNNDILVFEDEVVKIYKSFNPVINITKNDVDVCTGLLSGVVVCK
jgi:nucleoside-triphosphatase THEP1